MLFDHVWRVFAAAALAAPVWARMEHRIARSNSHRTSTTAFNNTLPWGDDPKELVKRDGTKYVFMHHIVGNTYPYAAKDWEDDIREIQSKGADAVALNIGSSEWQRERVAQAYAAAASLGTNFKLFYSFDFAEMSCNLDDIVARINLYANHPNQFKVNGKVFVSSYAGDCLGNDGWKSLKSRTNAYIMPFIWGLEGKFGSWDSLDSWYCWGCAYPQGNYDKTTGDDLYYMSQLGSKYATTISAWQFTHFPYKNWYLRGDNWLLNNRWEQLISMRNDLTFVELITWNDFGEGNYFGPTTRGAQPAGTYWADDFPHTAWYDMSAYYIQAFKTGSYPAIQSDIIYFWSKPHPAKAIASADSIGRTPIGGPGEFDWAEDYLWAVAFTTAAAQVTLKMGSSQQTFSVNAGVTKLKFPSAAGKITVQMTRSGQTLIDQTPAGFTYITNPVKYNLNAWVGSATATPGSSSSSTTTATTTSTTTPTSTSTATPTTTSVAGSTWTYEACYDDPTNNRVLQGLTISENTMTISRCLTLCSNEGFVLAGVEYGKECYCGQSLRTGSIVKATSECNMVCAGNANENCGAGNRIAVYSRPTPTTTATSTPTPTTTSISGTTWTYRGCYPDGADQRTLYDGGSTSGQSNTVSQCLASCASKGFALGGVEYGIECFCGSAIRSGVTAVYGSECSQPCAGNANEICGAGNRIGIYERSTSTITTTSTTTTTTTAPTSTSTFAITGFTPRGCIAEGTSGTRRALTGASYTRNDVTPQLCNSLCSSFQYSGVENGNECYCGNTLTNNGASGTVIAESNCATPCAGDSSQKCGGGWTVGTSQKTTVTFTALGCYVDGSDRMLRAYTTTLSSSMTTEKCLGICLERGYKLAATQDGRECHCDNQIYKTGSVGNSVSDSSCSSKCSGNSAQTCGAGWRNQLYSRP